MLTAWYPCALNASADARAICALRSLGRLRTAGSALVMGTDSL
jgi:hypothetical protein